MPTKTEYMYILVNMKSGQRNGQKKKHNLMWEIMAKTEITELSYNNVKHVFMHEAIRQGKDINLFSQFYISS